LAGAFEKFFYMLEVNDISMVDVPDVDPSALKWWRRQCRLIMPKLMAKPLAKMLMKL
jgi:hypothetical protein